MASWWWIQIVVSCILCNRSAHAVFCSMRILRIKNGDYNLRAGNSVATFTCNAGFTMLGTKQIVCFGSTWSTDPPICIANTCQKINESPTLRIKQSYGGAMLKFSCTVMHELEGAETLICDGSNWSANPPSCKAWDPPTRCDFEDPQLCGWSHHDEDEQEWIWNTGATKTTRTGPSQDHTLGNNGTGHYMYFESSSPTRTGHQAWLSSPLYPISYSGNYCFNFWYHSLGVDSMGTLEVFIKPELSNLTADSPVFYLNSSTGEQWQFKQIPITTQTQPYQMFFVATRGSSYRSDFAIDDVNLQKCEALTTTKTTPITTTKVKTTIRPTTVPVTTASLATTTPTTKPMKTTVPTAMTTVLTTGITNSTIQPTSIKSTERTSTKFNPPTTVPKNFTNMSTNPPKLTHPTTRAPPVTSRPITRFQSTTQHSQTQGLSAGSGRDSSATKVAYILIGVGLCIIVAVAAGVGLYIYRRRKNKFTWTKESAFATENPLYKVLASDDSAIQFANLNDE